MRVLATFLAILFSLGVGTAQAERRIGFAGAADPADALVIGMRDAQDLSSLASLAGAETAAAAARAALRAGFTAKAGASLTVLSGAERFGEIYLLGVGSEPISPRDAEDFGGRAALLAAASKAARVVVAPPDGADLSDVAFGAALGQYAFDKYKSDAKPGEGALDILAADPAQAETAWRNGRRHLADAVKWTRDLISEPANALYPEEFVTRTRAAFRGAPNVTISVYNETDMRRLGMGAIAGVGQGSVRPPRMLIVEYKGGRAGDAPLVFAGKGITFDSGGITIKPNEGMWRMKYDMAGAAAVTGAALGLARSRAPVNVVAIAALAENMPSGAAQRPGDVVRTMSGLTVEIISTDAEGRLVLADAVWLAQQRYAPKLLVDVATLTGSAGRALSKEYAALFARDDAVAAALVDAGAASGEELWRLPLHENYRRQIRSDIADIKNSGAGDPGAGVGAAFIGAFVKEETPWAHIDIAGVAWRTDDQPTVPKGAAGFSVRLLDRLARDYKAAP